MKKLNNKLGFTLVETLVAIGIMGVIITVVMSTQKLAIKSTGDLQTSSEVNNLIQLLTSELSRQDVCLKNFNPTGTPSKAIGAAMTNVVNQTGTAIITAGSKYGEEITINTIATAAGAIANQMNLKVTYTPHNKTAQSFIIPINVFLIGGLINSCYTDLQSMLIQAVRYACLGDASSPNNGARYVAPVGSGIGSCEHEVELKNEAGTVVAPVGGAFLCPAGQFISKIDSTTGSGKWTFKCTSVNAGCNNWEYLKGIDATGNPICTDVRTLFSSTGFMVLQSGVFQAFPVACSGVQILQSITGAGTLNCVNPRFTYTCPVNQYVKDIDASGNVICAYSTNSNSCAAGSTYIKAIDTAGNVTCGAGTPPNSCASNQVITGIDGSGYVICGAMP